MAGKSGTQNISAGIAPGALGLWQETDGTVKRMTEESLMKRTDKQ